MGGRALWAVWRCGSSQSFTFCETTWWVPALCFLLPLPFPWSFRLAGLDAGLFWMSVRHPGGIVIWIIVFINSIWVINNCSVTECSFYSPKLPSSLEVFGMISPWHFVECWLIKRILKWLKLSSTICEYLCIINPRYKSGEVLSLFLQRWHTNNFPLWTGFPLTLQGIFTLQKFF